MVYKWKNKVAQADAQLVGKQCEELSRTVGLSGKTLLDANRNEGDLLYDYFEWDNEVASEKWRVEQARRIITQLIVVDEQTNNQPVRGFYSLETKAFHKESNYHSFIAIMKSEENRNTLLEIAIGELKAFRTKYAKLDELRKVFEIIDDLKEETAI